MTTPVTASMPEQVHGYADCLELAAEDLEEDNEH